MRQLTKIFLTFFLVSSALFAQYTSDEMIEYGLEWLANNQTVVTSSPQLFERENLGSEAPKTSQNNSIMLAAGGYWYNHGITGLALQAFAAHGHGLDDPDYGDEVRNAVDYILSEQDTVTGSFSRGNIGNGFETGYETAMCIGALKAVLKLGVSPDSLKMAIENAVDLAITYYTQDIDSANWDYVSWRYNRTYFGETSGDMSANQWVYLALFDTEYDEKDVWQKIYNYINDFSNQTDSTAYLGYTPYSPNTWSRGNSMAAIWGLILANGFGITDAGTLVDKFYNWIELNTLAEVIDPASISTHVYSGGGYHYYLYEFAKAMALGGRTQFLGSDWYTELETELASRASEPTPGQLYWDSWGGQGSIMETALAVLSLQTGTVPPDSKFRTKINVRPADTSGISKNYNTLTADTSFQIAIYDALGNFAGKDADGNWVTSIPNSQWLSTVNPIELEVELNTASTFNIEIVNDGGELLDFDINYEAYQGGSNTPTTTKSYSGSLAGQQSIGSTANVNAIGGLNIFATSPTTLPYMQLSESLWYIDSAENDSTYAINLEIAEVGDSAALNDITVFASDLVDQFGNTIPKANYTFTPNSISKIDKGTSDSVLVSLTVPDSGTIDLSTVGLLKGTLTIQSNRSTKAVQVRLGRVFPTVDLISPPNMAANTETDINFQWEGDEDILLTNSGGKSNNRVQTVTKYWFQLVTNTTTMDGLIEDSTLTDTTYNVAGLSSNQTYYWRVAGLNQYGWGNFSQWYSFTTKQSGSLAAPLLVSPANNTAELELPYIFEWSAILGADAYEILMAQNSTFNDIVYNKKEIRGSSSFLVKDDFIEDGKKYYWKIRANTDAGQDGPFSLAWNFTTYLPSPTELMATSSEEYVQVDLSWIDNSNGEKGFIIYRAVGMDISNDELFTAIDTSGEGVTTYTDLSVMENTAYTYKIAAYTDDVESETSNIASASTITSVNDEGIPTEYTLNQNYPNPFNPTTTIRFGLPFESEVRLDVFNLLGQKVITLVDDNKSAGYHRVEFNGNSLASGIYFYSIKAKAADGSKEFNEVKKLMLMK